jgi:hypothetical protein
MDTQILTKILEILTPIINVVVVGLSVIITLAISRWSTREKLKVMKENAKLAVDAAEQIGWNKTNDEKRELGLQIANELNQIAGVPTIQSVQLHLNEANVLSLPPTKDEKIPNSTITPLG